MKSTRSRGFTLIELLVVIAIIGLLASIILASLNTARSKGADATAQGDLDNIRTQSAIYYSNNNNYGTNGSAVAFGTGSACTTSGTLFADPNVTAQIKSADSAEGGSGAPSKVECGMAASGGNWVVFVPLQNNTGSNTGWCIDSTGTEKADTTPGTNATACP